MKLGTENRKQIIVAGVLGVVLLIVIAYEFMPSSSTIASTTPSSTVDPLAAPIVPARSAGHHAAPVKAKKETPAQSLDPTLHLKLLAATEAIQYDGSGRNIFISQQEDVKIPTVIGAAATDHKPGEITYTPPVPAPQPPIPLKFFGFASRPGEPKKIFLIKGDDTFIAGEGEIVDRRYKVVKISPTSVDIQDVVGSGPPQNIPLTQGNPS
ncbi:MAG: hypothetical protein ABSB14_12405 [Candidatus Sulfotelmatobacter sp.]